MRKIAALVLTSLLVFSSLGQSVSAKQNDKLNLQELKTLNTQLLKLVQNDEENKIDDLSLVKKYRELFKGNPNLIKEYTNSFDKFDTEKINEKLSLLTNNSEIDTTKLGVESKKIVVMDDGSFIVIKDKVVEKIPESQMSTMGTVTGESTYSLYGYYTNTVTEILEYVLYPDGKEVLNTDFRVSGTGITIETTNQVHQASSLYL
ncbi:hypothetical protein G9F72_003090 [Clostridium estertheticum]|uniref:hypothetical protein n=1 Tax=Clostridium estertheticum TaxID=238834 RepID=UPI0013E98A66|nr:hypothetical protein [Clostridium estertheticum]MBZ9685335.1 hypothetical protein [Clostridium estertheticum]